MHDSQTPMATLKFQQQTPLLKVDLTNDPGDRQKNKLSIPDVCRAANHPVKIH